MKARVQDHINQYSGSDEETKYFPPGYLVKAELTTQQKEFLFLGEELRRNMSDLNSPFQNFLKYSPDSLSILFDQCLVKPCDVQIQGEVFFDFFLFETEPWNDSEMEIFSSILAARKERFLLHPLFDAFLKLKWKRTCYVFYFYIVWVLFYHVLLIVFSLNKFSFLDGSVGNQCLWTLLVVFHAMLILHSILEMIILA